jgi:membrane protease subunit HflC
VNESEQVVITQFGKPIGEPVTDPGVHFKLPFLQEANFFEKRFLEWDGDPNQVPTKDKKFIFVDAFARWQITDPLQFFKRLRDERGAQSRLDDILDGETRNAIAGHDLLEIVRSTNRKPEQSEEFSDIIEETLDSVGVGKPTIESEILANANQKASDLGIVILDFRIKRLNYVQEVRLKVYDRMISERNRIADKFKSEGQGEASRINGEKERKLLEIQSEAERRAQEIMGKADAEAANIYAQSYNRNNTSRQLYEFLRTMESYEKTFDGETSLILSVDSEFYQYLKKD